VHSLVAQQLIANDYSIDRAIIACMLYRQHTVLVFSADNGGDSGDSSNFPLRGRKRTFFSGGVRAVSFLASPMLPAARRGGRAEKAFFHISDWYPTFLNLAKVTDDLKDTSGGARFGVDGRDLWPYLSDASGEVAPPPFEDNILVLGYNYSTLCNGQPNCTAPVPGVEKYRNIAVVSCNILQFLHF
jgi:arylsulfatase A-like enzyme